MLVTDRQTPAPSQVRCGVSVDPTQVPLVLQVAFGVSVEPVQLAATQTVPEA